MSTIQYVTVAQWLASSASGLNVRDTPANIAAALPATPSKVAQAASFSLSGNGALAGAALAKIAALTNFSLNSFQLTVSDAAYVLLSLSRAEIRLIAHATLTGSPTLNAAQLTQLESLPGFTVAGGDHVTVSDSLTNIAAAIGMHPAWFTPVSVVAVRLDGAHIGAYAAAQLGLLEAAGKTVTFTAGANTTVSVTAAAASIAASAAGLADLTGHVTVTYTVSTPIVAVTAADGATLAGLAGFDVAAQALPVADTGANIAAHAAALFGHGFASITVSSGNFAGTAAQLLDPTLHEAVGATVSLGTSATVAVDAANQLATLAGFAVGGAATLTVQDNVGNILLLSTPALMAASAVALAGSQAATVTQLTALANLGGKFGEGGFTLSVQDTAANLEAMPAAALRLAGQVTVLDTASNIAAATSYNWGSAHVSYVLSQAGTISAAQATTLAYLGAALNLNSLALSVADTAANVLSNRAALATLGIQAGVSDSVANLTANEAALVNLGASLASVAIVDNAAETAAAVAALAPLAAKIVVGPTLTVSDTASNVSINLAALEAIGAKLGAHLVLQVTGTAAQLAPEITAFSALGVMLHVTVTGGGTVTADQAVALAPYSPAATLTVQDTGANVARDAAQLAPNAAAIGTLTLTDAGSTYTAAIAGAIGSAGLDTHLGSGVQLTVADTAAAIGAAAGGLLLLTSHGKLGVVTDSFDNAAGVAANAALLNTLHASVTVVDTTAAVQHNLDGLAQALGLTRVTLSDAGGGGIAPITASVAQLTTDASLIQDIITSNPPGGGQTYKIYVQDTAANIAADLASLTGVIAGAAYITQFSSTTGPVTLTYAQASVAAVANALTTEFLNHGGTANITGVTVANLGAAVASFASANASLMVADTAANLTNGMATLDGDRAHIGGITVTDATPVTLDVAQLQDLGTLFSHSAVLRISDSQTDISNDLQLANGTSHLIAELIANPSSLTSIGITSGASSLELTAADVQSLASHNLLATFAALLPAGVTLSLDANLADLAQVAAVASGQLAHISIVLADTAANLAADLLSGNSLLQHYSTVISSVSYIADPAMTPPTLSAQALTALYNYGITNPNGAPVTLPVQDNAANIAALNATAAGQAILATPHDTITILDSAAQITANLTALGAHVIANLTITLTDPGAAIPVNWSTFSANQTTLDTISTADVHTGRGPVVVTDTAALVDAHHAALQSDIRVGSIVVSDSASGVAGANLANIEGLGTLVTISLTDPTLLAGTLSAVNNGVTLLQATHLSATGSGVLDTAQNIAALAETGGASGIAAKAFLNTYGATLTGLAGGYVTVTDMTALAGLTDLHTNSQSLVVFDTIGNLVSSSGVLAPVLTSPLLSAVYLNAPANAATATAAQAVALFTIPHFHNTDLSSTANTISVSDSAANIDAVHTQLAALGAQITHVVVSQSATISDATLGDLQALGAIQANGGVQLTVSDTAANIASNALAQTAGTPSIGAFAWQLSTSGAVTISQAVVLGGLSLTTNPGGHQLAIIINLATDTTIAAADANAMANLQTSLALNLAGHQLRISDTTAHLAALSNAAFTAIVPSATAVIVNDPTGATATDMVNLVAKLAAGDITSSQLGFANTESVTGSVADLTTLNTNLHTLVTTANTSWTGNTSLQGALQLTAADTVANLINLTHTVFLSSLHGTTVSANASTDAISAESLQSLASQIHFSLGSNTLTVIDTAVNLLAAANQAGVAMATAVDLTPGGPALDAADAASLLSLHNLVLSSGNPLTISDTAANLLNSGLDMLLASSPYSAYITVDLAVSAPVTIQQGEALAELPNFTPSTNLLIADSSAHLLNAANAAFLSTAQAVTLAGNETVSAATILALAALSNFNPAAPGGVLTLAANDTANPATLVAIANLGANFSAGGHTLTLTGPATVNSAQFQALLNDGVLLAGNTVTISDTASNLTSLLTNSAWTNLAMSVQNNYQWVATDTVQHLIALGGLTAHLHGIGIAPNSHPTLIGADATTLATVADTSFGGTINYNGQTVTVNDTVANINTYLTGGHTLAPVGEVLQLTDTAAHLEAALPAAITTASGNGATVEFQLQAGNAIVSVTDVQLLSLLAFAGFDANGNTLQLSHSVSVTGAQLKQLADLGASFDPHGNVVTVTGDVVLTAAELHNLELDNFGNFSLGAHVTVSDTPNNLIGLSHAALAQTAHLTLPGNTTLSPTQLSGLASLPNFTAGSNAITLNADALDLTPTQYANLMTEGVIANQVANGHVISASLAPSSATDLNSVLSFVVGAGGSVQGATVKVYDSHGSLLSSTREGQTSFTVTATDTADQSHHGQAFVFTEVVNGIESAPKVVLDQTSLQDAVTAAGASWGNQNGDIVVGNNETLHVYTAGDQALQSLANPALVYDPHAHTVSLDLPNAAPILLVTLGAATDPASLSASDFIIKAHA